MKAGLSSVFVTWYSTSSIVRCTSKQLIHPPLRFNYSSGKMMLQVTRRGLGTASIWFLVMKSQIQGQCQQAHRCDNQPTGTTPWPLLLLFYLFQSNTNITSTIKVLSSLCCTFYLTLNCFPCNTEGMTCRLLYIGEYALIQCTDFDYIWHGTYPPELSQKFQHPTSIMCWFMAVKINIAFYYMDTWDIWKAQYPSCYFQ